MTVNWTKDKGVKNYKVAYRKEGSSKWTIKKTSQPGYLVWNQKTRECYEYKVAAVIDTKEMWSDVDCRYFNTVLGPGSNPEHWNHFHFDLRSRKSGKAYCD
jgi:hypothetical protein